MKNFVIIFKKQREVIALQQFDVNANTAKTAALIGLILFLIIIFKTKKYAFFMEMFYGL